MKAKNVTLKDLEVPEGIKNQVSGIAENFQIDLEKSNILYQELGSDHVFSVSQIADQSTVFTVLTGDGELVSSNEIDETKQFQLQTGQFAVMVYFYPKDTARIKLYFILDPAVVEKIDWQAEEAKQVRKRKTRTAPRQEGKTPAKATINVLEVLKSQSPDHINVLIGQVEVFGTGENAGKSFTASMRIPDSLRKKWVGIWGVGHDETRAEVFGENHDTGTMHMFFEEQPWGNFHRDTGMFQNNSTKGGWKIGDQSLQQINDMLSGKSLETEEKTPETEPDAETA